MRRDELVLLKSSQIAKGLNSLARVVPHRKLLLNPNFLLDLDLPSGPLAI